MNELEQQLREQGYDVRVYHRRLRESDRVLIEVSRKRLKTDAPEMAHPKREIKSEISTKGGYTKAQILKGEEVVAEGESWCHPNLDNFSKRLGRQIALGRAMKQL